MASATLTKEEGWGLAISIAGHLGLLAVLLLRPSPGEVVIPPQRVEVTLSEDVGLTSTAPEQEPPTASVAPMIGDALPEPSVAEPVPAPVPEAVRRPAPPKAEPKPEPRPVPRPTPKATPKPTPRPVPKQTPPPAPKAAPAPRAAPKAAPPKTSAIDNLTRNSSSTRQPATKSTRPAPAAKAAPKAANPGGSRIGSDFLEGGVTSGTSRASTAAATFGAREQASLKSAISRQLRPHWTSPQGVDVEQLVTMLDWDLNPDGSLAGPPRLRGQSGETESNQAQKSRHAELAIRAVQRAAPFELPSQYYDHWKRIRNWRFDRNTSQ